MTLKISLKAFDIVYLIKAWPYKFLYRKKNFGLLEIKFKMFLVIWINFNSWIFNSKCLQLTRNFGQWLLGKALTVSVSCQGQWWIPAIQIQFTIHMCVGYFFLNSYNLIIIFTNISMHNTWFYFRFFLGQVLETKMLRRLQSKSKIIRYFYRKFLGFSEQLLLQLHAIQLQNFVSNRVIRHFNIGKIKFKYLI